MGTLTLSMIVKNEEENLPRALSNISGICDEIIIVDTGSEDRTVEIAKSFGATVREMAWENDFAKARNLSIKDASSDWILWLDGDDYVPEDSIPHIKELLNRPADTVYAFTVKNERPDGTGTEFLQARLFPNRKGLLFERPVHEQIMLSAVRKGMVMTPSAAWVEHHGYADGDLLKEKAARNVAILEKNLHVYGDDPVTFVEIGDSYTIMEDSDTAEMWYKRAIALPNASKQFPDIVSQAWMGLGNISNDRKSYAEAENCFNNVIKLCPGRIDIFYSLAVTYERQEQYEKAIDTLMQIFTTSSKKVKVGVDVRQAKIRGGMKMVRLLLKWGNQSALNEKLPFLLEVKPERMEIVNACGAAYYSMGDYMKALELFRHSADERPEGNVDALIGLSLIYVAAGKDDLAIGLIQQGDDLFSESCRFQLFRSLITDSPVTIRFPEKKVKSELAYLHDLFKIAADEDAIVQAFSQESA